MLHSLCTVDLKKLIKVYSCRYEGQIGRVVEHMSPNLDIYLILASFFFHKKIKSKTAIFLIRDYFIRVQNCRVHSVKWANRTKKKKKIYV